MTEENIKIKKDMSIIEILFSRHTSWRKSTIGFETMIYEKIVSRRTIRKYLQKDVPKEVLTSCVDAARLSHSGANRQSLKYVIIDDENLLKEVFGSLSWAGYLSDYKPSEEEILNRASLSPRALIRSSIFRTSKFEIGWLFSCVFAIRAMFESTHQIQMSF